VKNQLVERVIKTFKELMLKYIYMYGWPVGTIVYREPSKEHEGTYTKNLHRVYDFDPYELRVITPKILKKDLMSPLTLDYLQTKYGKKILENVEDLIEEL
jgi:hypothetical protein